MIANDIFLYEKKQLKRALKTFKVVSYFNFVEIQ